MICKDKRLPARFPDIRMDAKVFLIVYRTDKWAVKVHKLCIKSKGSLHFICKA